MPPEMEPVYEWLDRAEHDLQAADLVARQMPNAPEIAVFHCQQAVEKFLKAYLTFAERTFKKLHDLDQIVTWCSESDASFLELRSVVAPLRQYAVEVRYPHVMGLKADDVRIALGSANTVRDFVRARIPGLEDRPAGR